MLNRDEKILYVAATRSNRIISMPLLPDYKGVSQDAASSFSFPAARPDPTAWRSTRTAISPSFTRASAPYGSSARLGEPLYRIKSCAGMRTTNVAFGGPDRKTLFITEAEHGVILKAQLPTRRPHHVRSVGASVLKSPLDVLNLYPAHDHTLNGVLSTRRSSRGA